MNEIVILCDFDGTITVEDTGVVALDYFTEQDWRYYDTLLEQQKMTLEECIKTQFEMLDGQKSKILEIIKERVSVRPNAKKFINFCYQKDINLIILSAGLDFAIEYFMEQIDSNQNISIYSPKTSFIDNKLVITFPNLNYEDSKNFKEDIVKKYKKDVNYSIYIGNGLSDFEGVRAANFSYVVNKSKLANLCKTEHIPHKEFQDFAEIIEDIEKRFF